MKRLSVFVLLMLSVWSANAQSDTTQQLPDSVLRRSGPDPQSWYNSELPKDAAPKKDSVLLTLDQLPSVFRKSLDEKKAFDGWRNGAVYFDRVTKNYKLFFPRGKNTEWFVLDEKANVLSYQSFISPK
jgi:hypothetical protein